MEKHFKQLIIARRDLNMSPGKLAAQVSHASSAFLIEMIRDSWPEKIQDFYQVNYRLDKDVYDNWINDGVTKVVCGARNRGKLEKAIEKAKELGMIEGVDYFPIVDACRTELTPESPQGTLTCVGFRPMEAEKIDEIGKDFHLSSFSFDVGEIIKILVTDLTSIIVLLFQMMAMTLQKRKMVMILFSILLQNDKSFAIGEKYIEIGRVTYATAI